MKTFADYSIDVGAARGIEVKCLCPKCSHTRKKKNFKCLNVNTDKGVWNCWHCGWSGSLKAGEWQRPEIVREYVRPAYPPQPPKQEDSLLSWFKKRGIPQEVVERNRITKGVIYFPQVEEELPCIQFPFYRGDEVINVKYRSQDKLFRLAAGAERILYGVNDIGETLIWVEGEIDKLSVEVAGFPSCVSVPDGAPAPETKNYESKFDFLSDKALEKVKQHIIAVDNDGPGKCLQDELVRRLGPEKCLIASWPDGCKDANDVLVKHGAAAIEEALSAATPVPVQGTHRVQNIWEEMRREYQFGAPQGLDVGWKGLAGYYRVLPGEWTLVTGIPGDGKSEWLDALTINLARAYGWNFGVFSPENQPITYHVRKIAEKYIGKPFEEGPTPRMGKEEFEEAMQWINDHYVFINPEFPKVDDLISIGKQLVTQNGIKGFIIDPWNEINHTRESGMTETEHISHCITKIRTFARNYGVHIWVVAHPTKITKDPNTGRYPVPTPYDVAGSAHWRNKADNCITVYRDQQEGSSQVQIHVQKVRKKTNGRIGMATLLWDRVTGQYRDDTPGYMPKIFEAKQARKA